jgi:hypothetical protein
MAKSLEIPVSFLKPPKKCQSAACICWSLAAGQEKYSRALLDS